MILNICDNGDVLSVIRIINIAILIIKIAVPIILILSLLINYLKAVYNSDDEALAKANKQAVNKAIAAILIFFIPTFVNVLVRISTSNNGYAYCMTNATEEKIAEAYINQAQESVDYSKKNPTRGNYSSAKLTVSKLKDKSEKERLTAELDAILKEIEAKEEEEKKKEKTQFGNLDTDFWFPVGGSEVKEINGVKFAPGTPVATVLTAHFGGNDSVHQGLGGGHGAIDIGAGKWTYVIASKSGTVVYPGANDRIDYPDSAIKLDANGKYNCRGLVANSVTIDHGDGTKTSYAHFTANTITVRAGDHVTQGQIIGQVGSSGCSTAPHLHFSVSVNGKSVDPEKYVSGSNPRP